MAKGSGSKRMNTVAAKISKQEVYQISDAVQLLTECSAQIKFKESVDVAVRLGVDTKKSDQSVRGSAVLPHGTGKSNKVAVFADGEAADVARGAGADLVAFEDLLADIKEHKIDFDVLITLPEHMPKLGKLGQILGPKGLMPNPKVGTVTKDIAKAVHDAKGGQVRFRNDKQGIVHCSIGKVDFSVQAIKENLGVLLDELKKLKPQATKGVYLQKIVLSTTMGPGLQIDQASIV